MNYLKMTTAALALTLTFGMATQSCAPMAMKEKTVMVGGAQMYPSKNIVENAMNSKDHTTLVAAVKAAGLVETLQSDGPFTVFAPTNAAFAKLPAGTVDMLVIEWKGAYTHDEVWEKPYWEIFNKQRSMKLNGDIQRRLAQIHRDKAKRKH